MEPPGQGGNLSVLALPSPRGREASIIAEPPVLGTEVSAGQGHIRETRFRARNTPQRFLCQPVHPRPWHRSKNQERPLFSRSHRGRKRERV